MKRSIFLLFTIVSIFCSVLNAAPIERATALQHAKQFLNQTSVRQLAPGKAPASMVESVPTYTAEDTVTGTPLYYIYNLSNDGGFVIVAADTRVRTILGYSFNGGFDKNNVPINMREWLNEYSSQITYAIKEMPESDTRTTIARSPAANNAVAPLLGDIKYDQDAPYNNLCPMDNSDPDNPQRSVTGCVATAMAQVMRYHQHPQVGKGTKTYTTQPLDQELTVDFSATNYDWENMLPSYVSTATDGQKTAVATLMYHAGVAAEMDYSASASGANMYDAAIGLYEHFDYDIGIDLVYREYYSASEWFQLIKAEIDDARPIIMSGSSSGGGHAFVCDGYDADNFMHFNWGWSGYQDGYFQLSALDPAGGGIGAGSGGYNLYQTIIRGIQKSVQGSVASSSMMMYGITVDKTSITGTETAQFVISDFRAASLFGFNGYLGLALYDEDGNFVKTIRAYSTYNQLLEPWWGWETFPISDITISDIRPDASTTGTYYIKPVCRPQGEVNWKPVLSANGIVREIKADITATSINFEVPEMTFTLSEAASAVIKNSPNAIFYGNNLNVELQILNTGNVEYQAQIGVKAVSLADENNKYAIANVKTILPVGETTTVNLSGLINFPVGQYKLEAYYNPANQEDNFNFPQTKLGSEMPATQFSVVEAPPAYNLSLTKANEMPMEVEQGTPFIFKTTIKNTGGLYAGDLVLEFLERRSDDYYYYIGKPKTHYVEILTETKEVVIECALNLPVGSDYVAMLNYTNYTSGETVPIEQTYNNINFFSVRAKPIIQVSANPAEGGTVTGGGSVASGTSHTVTATANAGYIFTNWTEDGTVVSTVPSYTFTVEADRELVANFIVSNFRTRADGNWENPATWQVSSDKLTWENATTVPTADAASISVEHAITVNTPISNVNNLTIKSGATLKGDISGNATVEQVADNNRTYYIGSPVSGATDTGVGAAIEFTESSNKWTTVTTPFTTVGKGYGVQVGKGLSGTTTLSFTGSLNNGDKSIEMTVGDRKFNFFSNPYPSFLDATKLELANIGNIEGTLWFLSKADGYNFATLNIANGTATPSTATGSLDGLIAPLQGFWVRSEATATTDFVFNNEMRAHKGESKSVFRVPQASERQELRLQISNATDKDELVMLFSEEATNKWNSSKMMNSGLNIYTLKNGKELVINSLTAIEYDVETAVGVKAESGVHIFSVIKYENFGAEKVFLLDKATGVSTELSSGESYTVNFAEAYEGTDRFALVFPRSGVITGWDGAMQTEFFAFANNNRITVNSDVQEGVIYVFNGVGQQVAAQAISGKLTTVNTALPAGVYLVKLNNKTTKVVVK